MTALTENGANRVSSSAVVHRSIAGLVVLGAFDLSTESIISLSMSHAGLTNKTCMSCDSPDHVLFKHHISSELISILPSQWLRGKKKQLEKVRFSVVSLVDKVLPDRNGKRCMFFLKTLSKTYEMSASDTKQRQEWTTGKKKLMTLT